MRTFLVVLLTETVEGTLLVAARGGRRRSGLLLQGTMHTLVTTVLLRMSRLNPFRNDAQFHQVHRQARQTGDRTGRERCSVVGADGQRHAKLAKSSFHHRPHLWGVGAIHGLAAQKIPAVSVAKRERIDTLCIPCAK